jgi:hypothetical protein
MALRAPDRKSKAIAVPENRPHSANLTPDEMRQGIERVKRRITDVTATGSAIEASEYYELDTTLALHERMVSTLAMAFGDTAIECKR